MTAATVRAKLSTSLTHESSLALAAAAAASHGSEAERACSAPAPAVPPRGDGVFGLWLSDDDFMAAGGARARKLEELSRLVCRVCPRASV